MAKSKREQYITKLAKGECEVFFTKVDGTSRHMWCTTNPELIPDEKLPKLVEGKEPKAASEETVVCFDTTIKEWRSFRVDSVINFVSQ